MAWPAVFRQGIQPCSLCPAILLLHPLALQVAEAFPNAQGVLITAGEEGAAYCFKSAAKGESAGFIPCYNVKVAETTGAGDAFTAGFIYKLLQVRTLGRMDWGISCILHAAGDRAFCKQLRGKAYAY